MPNLPVQEIRGELPPCLWVAVFDGRRAWRLDAQACGHPSRTRFVVVADQPIKWIVDWSYHPGIPVPFGPPPSDGEEVYLMTDDEAEAEEAWKRAVEWVERREPDGE